MLSSAVKNRSFNHELISHDSTHKNCVQVQHSHMTTELNSGKHTVYVQSLSTVNITEIFEARGVVVYRLGLSSIRFQTYSFALKKHIHLQTSVSLCIQQSLDQKCQLMDKRTHALTIQTQVYFFKSKERKENYAHAHAKAIRHIDLTPLSHQVCPTIPT